jgi:hypothetical protein
MIHYNVGKQNPMYGKHHTKKTKLLIGATHKNKHVSDETKEKIRFVHIGKHHSDETKRKMSKSHIGIFRGNKHPSYGKPLSVKTRKKLSKALSGNKNPFYGKHHSKATKKKIRGALIGRPLTVSTKKKIALKLRELRLGKVTPNFNPIACQQIDEYGQKHGYNFQHAMNGGEVRVIGYALDGYDKKKNTAIEYYEHYHNEPKQKKRDKQRKQEIINHLRCKFIELKEKS